MKIVTYEDYEALSLQTALSIAELVIRKPNALLCLPAGDTPIATYKHLVEMYSNGQFDFSGCSFVGLDEWVGLDRFDKGSCKEFMYTHLFVPLNIDESKIHFFDAKATDLQAECNKMNAIISHNGPIDLIYLGLGMNGHLGFNEPGVDFSGSAHVVELDATTKSVGQKYFQQQTNLELGITIGIKQIMESKAVLLGVSGFKKAGIVNQTASGEITNKVPGSILQTHENSILMLDRDAASSLEGYNET